MSNRFHNKFHRQNHHSKRTSKNNAFNDASYDPIASYEEPFQGEFFSEGDILTTENLSAQKGLFAENAVIKNNVTVQNDVQITGALTVGDSSSFGSNLTVQQNLSVAGNTTNNGNLFLSGNAYIDSNVYVQQNLTVSNNISSSGTATFGTIPSDITNDVIIKDVNNSLKTREINPIVWDTTANLLSGSLTQNYLPKFNSGSSLINSNIYDNGVFVGINTNSPTDTLTVQGSSKFFGNVTIFGDLTATGTSTFANTLFSTTSALSVVHIGSGPAAWIGNEGTGDIASFYDIDAGVEILHVGGINSDNPNVGIKTSTPNVDFTVNGEISASGSLYALNGTFVDQITSNGAVFLNEVDVSNNLIINVLDPVSAQDAVTKNYADALSATLQISINTVETNLTSSLTSVSAYAEDQFLNVNTELDEVSAYVDVQFNDVNTFIKTNFLPLSGGNLTGSVTTLGSISALGAIVALSGLKISGGTTGNVSLFVEEGKLGINTETPNEALTVVGSVSATSIFYGDGSGLINTDNLNVNTVVQNTSANWNDVYSTVQTNSATEWNYQGTDLKNLSANWESTFNTVYSLSSSWEESAETIPTVTNYLSTNNVLISSLTVLDTLSVSGDFNVGAGVGEPALYVNVNVVGINTEAPNKELTVVGSISATGIIHGDGSGLSNVDNLDVNTTVQTNSAYWNSVYTTVQTNSSISWNYQGTDIKALTGNWESTYTTFTNNSASFVQTDVTNTTPGLSAITRLVAVSALPLVQEVGTLYVLI